MQYSCSRNRVVLEATPTTDLPLLLQVSFACIAGGILSLAAAALVMYGLPKQWLNYAVSFSIGIRLATSMLHLLPDALEVAERLRQNVAMTAIPVDAGEPVRISVSIGVAATSDEDTGCACRAGAHEPGALPGQEQRARQGLRGKATSALRKDRPQLSPGRRPGMGTQRSWAAPSSTPESRQ